jgi:hypothetical protein
MPHGLRRRHVRNWVFGDEAAHPGVLLIGDSHAAQWFPALDRMAVEDG